MPIRPASPDDSREILEIRNHPLIRAASSNTASFSFKEHDQWFKDQYFNPQKNNKCFVLQTEQDGIIGYCRYDFDAQSERFIVSIALDPAHQGQGHGHRLLFESLALLLPAVTVHAEVKKDNVPSLKLFLKNHFVIYNEDDVNVYLIHSHKH
ncbi:MAG: GNAT family N-acetyltransferase [Waddliaceae bacterium]